MRMRGDGKQPHPKDKINRTDLPSKKGFVLALCSCLGSVVSVAHSRRCS